MVLLYEDSKTTKSVGRGGRTKMIRKYPITTFWIEVGNACKYLSLIDIANQVDDCIQEQLLAEYLGYVEGEK